MEKVSILIFLIVTGKYSVDVVHMGIAYSTTCKGNVYSRLQTCVFEVSNQDYTYIAYSGDSTSFAIIHVHTYAMYMYMYLVNFS